MKTRVYKLRGLRYQLRMMGVAKESATHMYENNMSVTKNTSKPESTLNLKSDGDCYHAVRESIAIGGTLTVHTHGSENVVDQMTKVLSGGNISIKCTSLHMTFTIKACTLTWSVCRYTFQCLA